MNWTIGTWIYWTFIGAGFIAVLIDAFYAARPPRPRVTMERVEFADAAADAEREQERLRREVADLYVFAEGVRDQIRMPPFVGVIDPEHTVPLRPTVASEGVMPTNAQAATWVLRPYTDGEETAPLTVAVYTSNGRYKDPTREP